MDRGNSKKRVALFIIAGVILLCVGLVYFFFSDRSAEELSTSERSARKTQTARADGDDNQSRKVPNQVSQTFSKVSEASQSTLTKLKFNNADELCKDFAEKASPQWTEDQFAEALMDHIRSDDHALEDWLQSITSVGSPRQKGAALSLLLASIDRKVRKEVYAQTPNCDQLKECSGPLEALVGQKTSPYAYALVNHAIYSSDPVLYGMAHNICKRFSFDDDTVCDRVGALQWMKIDPDNGVAALYALGELKLPPPNHDQTAFENALYRLSQANKFDLYFDVGNELPALPSTLDDYQHRTELESLRAYFWDITPLPPHTNITKACSGEYLKNANRRSLCEKVANQYLRENAFLLDRAIFLKLAAQLGGERNSLQKYRDDQDEVNGYYIARNERQKQQHQDSSGRATACHGILKKYADVSRYASQGEFKQFQQEAKQFGLSREELINIGRRSRGTRSD